MPINSYFVAVSLVLLRLLLRVVFVVRSHGFDCSSDSEQGTRARCKVYEMRSHTQPAALESDSASERGPEAERERTLSVAAHAAPTFVRSDTRRRYRYAAAMWLLALSLPLPLLLPLPLPCSLCRSLSCAACCAYFELLFLATIFFSFSVGARNSTRHKAEL